MRDPVASAVGNGSFTGSFDMPCARYVMNDD